MSIRSFEPNPTAENPVVAMSPRGEPGRIEFTDDDLVGHWRNRQQRIAGLQFVARQPRDAALDIARAAVLPERLHGEHIHLLNAWSIALADEDRRLRDDVLRDEQGWNLPDGKPLTWLSRRAHSDRVLAQVRGPQLMLDVADLGRAIGVRHFLLGSTPETLSKLQVNLERDYPGIAIVGSVSPPFRAQTEEEHLELDARIRESGAHVVWVGLGTPKQDFEALRIARSLPLLAVAVGAAFDYAAGTLRPAPTIFPRIGMEWFWRLCSEPKRLWRRYTIGSARFLRVALHDSRSMRRGTGR